MSFLSIFSNSSFTNDDTERFSGLMYFLMGICFYRVLYIILQSVLQINRPVPIAKSSRSSSSPVKRQDNLELSILQEIREKWSAHSKHRLSLYVLSAVHSSIVALFSLYIISQVRFATVEDGVEVEKILSDRSAIAKSATQNGLAPYWTIMHVLIFSLAYFVHDTISYLILHGIGHNYVDLLHHSLGILLISSCMASVAPARLSHHLLLTELSTPFLNVMWLMRKLKKDKGHLWNFFKYSFVAAFTFTRIFYLPWITYIALSKLRVSIVKYNPHVAIGMLALCALNFWWFARIIRMMMKPPSSEEFAAEEEEPIHRLERKIKEHNSAESASGKKIDTAH